MNTSLQHSIKAVVFDFGGVIQLWGGGNILEDIAIILKAPKDEFKLHYFNNNHLSNVKNMPWNDMIMSVVAHYTTDLILEKQVLLCIESYQSQARINYELTSWFPILKQQGYKIGILSNATTELRGQLDTLNISQFIDEVVVSGEIGFQKPHKEAFEVVFNKLGVLPQEVVFIDDAPKSLEKATVIGYHPILFRDNEQCKSDLLQFGIVL